MSSSSRWMVCAKGRINSSYEVAIVRESNTHGRKSWGWPSADKMFIMDRNAPLSCGTVQSMFNDDLHKVWNDLVGLAKRTAEKLNSEEGNPGTILMDVQEAHL